MALALITGASRGIGRAIALGLADDGFDVIVNFRSNEAQAAEVAALIRNRGRQAILAPFDVAGGADTERAVDALIQLHGCPDVVVNNAGITRDGLFPMMSRESWDAVLATSLGGFYSVTRPVMRQMIRKRAGRIVNIASVSGERGNAGQVNYSAAKAGLIGATKALALEVASRGITVNAVAPGFIETDMVATLPKERILPLIPMGRAGTPEEVAAAVRFLCSAGASYITGTVIDVNGGLYS